MQPDYTQSGHPYRLPLTNIAYHIHDDDLDHAQAISRQAFQRTLATYHEHEQLADRFQIELDKRERDTQERKEHEKLLKTQKHNKSSKRPRHGSLDRAQPPQPERQPLRRRLRSTGTTRERSKTVEGVTIGKAAGNQKRSRRNSGVSNSDISGYGGDDVRLLLPLTPSPRLTPSESRNENQGSVESGSDPSNRSPEQFTTNPTLGASLAPSTSSTSSTHWGHTTARRKRKQVIPVHPSIVERIPGITLRIQRELRGELLQVEILKNLEDYRAQQGDQCPSLKLQGTQDMQKIKESIDSGRLGNGFFPTLSSRQGLGSQDLREASSHHQGAATTLTGKTPIHRNQSLSSSLATLTWASSNGGSAESLATMADMMEARSLPLTWENFSTRDCVVNKVVGKYDAELDMLEDVVQDAVARKNLANQQNMQQQHEGDHDGSPTPIQSPRKPSGASAGSGAASTAATVSTNPRSSRASGTTLSTISSRSVPVRATRSRRIISDKQGDGTEGEGDLVTLENNELGLKQRHNKKLEKRRHMDGRGSFKDDEDGDGDDDQHTHLEGEDGDDVHSGMESTPQKETRREFHERLGRRTRTDENRDVEDGDAVGRRRKSLQGRQLVSNRKDDVSEGRGQVLKQTNVVNRSRVSSTRHLDSGAIGSDDNEVPSSSEEDNDAVDDGDYYDGNYKASSAPAPVGGTRRKRTLSDSKTAAMQALKLHPEPKASITTATTAGSGSLGKTFAQYSSSQKASMPILSERRKKSQTPISIAVLSGDGTRRNRKVWSRGRNTRKEDEVVDTTSDGSSESDSDDADEDRRMPLAKHPQSNRSMPIIADEQLGVRNTVAMSAAHSGMGTSTTAGSHDSGGRTRARARSFSSTIVTTDKINFFESALDVIDQKRRESIAKKKAAKAEAEEQERLERLEREQREQREKVAKVRQETVARLQEQGKAQKIEASNLPKSSKSLPGRVLRRSRADGSTDEGYIDLDCTSCRLELSADDRTLWKIACELGEIWLPKTWSAHAILCSTCRQQYLDHHSRCTACFYVPVEKEMATSGSSCSRCKAGTWLTEVVRI